MEPSFIYDLKPSYSVEYIALSKCETVPFSSEDKDESFMTKYHLLGFDDKSSKLSRFKTLHYNSQYRDWVESKEAQGLEEHYA